MPIDYSILKNELIIDPSGLGYSTFINNGNETSLVNLINQPFTTLYSYAKISDIQSYIDSNGLSIGIEDAAANSGTVEPIRQCARMATKLFSARYETVDVMVPAFGSCLDGLVAGGLMSGDDKVSIINLAATSGTRAESIFGIGTSINDIDISIALKL